jgi:hypothetical protein
MGQYVGKLCPPLIPPKLNLKFAWAGAAFSKASPDYHIFELLSAKKCMPVFLLSNKGIPFYSLR